MSSLFHIEGIEDLPRPISMWWHFGWIVIISPLGEIDIEVADSVLILYSPSRDLAIPQLADSQPMNLERSMMDVQNDQ